MPTTNYQPSAPVPNVVCLLLAASACRAQRSAEQQQQLSQLLTRLGLV